MLLRLFTAGLLVLAATAAARAQEAMTWEDPGDVLVRDATAPAPPDPAIRWGRETHCPIIESAAAFRGLPTEFFVRLIHQESRFNPTAVSHKGAQGIAQFMPYTASERGLKNPFDPFTAIHASAHLLADLRAQFGSVGLAAAAYNAGPQRVSDWLAGTRQLPGETRSYVIAITGLAADHWRDQWRSDWPGVTDAESTPTKTSFTCAQIAKRGAATRIASTKPQDAPLSKDNWGPWGLQLAGDFSQAKAMASYRKLQQRFASVLGDREPMVMMQRTRGVPAPRYLVRVAESSRERANALCARLSKLGGACLVYRN
ncbi:soluble lytic murein transglycosylase precursor [Variibacter gotjawalensis]|uniref:Soluble lytic murein transglycosylase n=1 Tax=Variibacter gotjawalensis TaxID=1333996 RepID=A0A0S3PV28_9BRAD|nr:lytic transglycosylase domain-containing protein [Variibacter gotjawalensis]NIK50136.1 hypothetical protein [Variibacter gotjawalensis]RZS46133.1 sporulation related protein [Variibacter gotjawalensis]BAT59809.1 soluble lytic murein transglycosylase precursor [Variibacter gotjawalensis]